MCLFFSLNVRNSPKRDSEKNNCLKEKRFRENSGFFLWEQGNIWWVTKLNINWTKTHVMVENNNEGWQIVKTFLFPNCLFIL